MVLRDAQTRSKLVKFLAQKDANQPEFRKTFLKVNSKALFSAKIHCIILPEELWSSLLEQEGRHWFYPQPPPQKEGYELAKFRPLLVLPEGTFHLAKEVPMVSVALPSIWIEKFFSITISQFCKHLEKWIEISVDNIELRACLGKLTDDWLDLQTSLLLRGGPGGQAVEETNEDRDGAGKGAGS